MYGLSLTPEQEKLNALKQALPEVFTEGKVDWEKLKATLGEDINFSNERYVLNWAGKSEAFKVLQAPTTKTLIPAKDESVNFDETEHIFIEGENLEVLKVLQKSYFGKVKMIYIDPPYNTGNDSFIYPDKFSETKEEYEKRVGDKDEEGYMTKDGMFKKNSKENGQYHSNWLNMMMPRLYLAKNLLKQDGVIFVSIDDNEVHNLRLLMNEIFGEENFVESIIWKKRSGPPNDKIIAATHEYVLIFAKSVSDMELNLNARNEKQLKRYRNPDNHPKGRWAADNLMANIKGGRGVASLHYAIVNPNTGESHFPSSNGNWRFNKDKVEKLLSNNEIYFGEDGKGRPKLKRFLSDVKDGVTYSTLWDFVPINTAGSREISQTMGNLNVFDTPKPTGLIIEILKLSVSKKDDLILDFFSGSGTTAHAVMELNSKDGGNRKCISIQLPELCNEKSEAYKAGYKTIADIAKERIRRAGKKIQEENPDYQGDLGFKVLKLSDSNFKQWQQIKGNDKEALEEQMRLFVDPVAKNATTENMVYELLLKSGKDLNSTIEAKDGFYAINETELILVLEKANQEIIDAVIASNPQKVIALDKLFKGNDQLKTNASLQMRDAGIEFKTI